MTTMTATAKTTRLPELLTVEDVAAYLHCSTTHVYRAARSGALRHYRVGSRLTFTEAQVIAYLESQAVEPRAKTGRPRRKLA